MLFIFGCSSESDGVKVVKNENGSLDNRVVCDNSTGNHTISNSPVKFELDCSERKLFRVYTPEANKDIAKYFVAECNEYENYKSAQLYTSSENDRTNLLVAHKSFIVVNDNVFCNGIDECFKACNAYGILRKINNVNAELEAVRTSTEAK